MQVEKLIAFKIRDQFPALYREFGPDLVEFVEEYYRFLEEETNQSVYNSRRLFEYRDISTTLSDLILQFHKMFMADLPLLDDQSVRFVVKNVMDLYRRKGTPGGVLLFFRMFYGEDVEIKYPASQMFKPSDSDWRKGVYLQLFPNDNLFTNPDDATNPYTYKDLIGKNIKGSISEARAAVDKINFVLINNTLTPVVYISNVKGDFTKFDDLLAKINGKEVAFGRVNGSPNRITIDLTYGGATGNGIGDILNIQSDYGQGGKVIVTDLLDEETGQVNYSITDKGFGYTEENTKIKASNQNIILSNPDFAFKIGERIGNTGKPAANTGIVTGQSAFAVGIFFEEAGQYLDANTDIILFDRAGTPLVSDASANTGAIAQVTRMNRTSPGDLYPNTGDANNDVKVSIDNIQSVSLITDVIGDFANVAINSSNYNTVPPAIRAMSGNTDPVTIATRLDEAFDLTPFDIGSIATLQNINPGTDYRTDVWTIARDETMGAFDRFEQIIVLEEVGAAMSKGDAISQANTGIDSDATVTGIITDVNASESFIKVRPYNYYGFESNAGDIVHKGNNYAVDYVSRDYGADKLGESAEIDSQTVFNTGRIKSANIYESGLGYLNNEVVFLTDDDGNIKARATLTADSQGITSGYWASQTSHLNGYWTDPDSGKFEYYNSNKKIQDSDYYQEYSYEIKGTIAKNVYEEPLKRTVHLAGTKLFGDFLHKRKMSFGPSNAGIAHKFTQIITLDTEVGGNPVVGPGRIIAGDGGLLDASTQQYTADTTTLSADMTQEP
jgi:hypothetical protein